MFIKRSFDIILSLILIPVFVLPAIIIVILIRLETEGSPIFLSKRFIKSIFIAGINIHTLTTLLDFLSTLYFIELKNKFGTNFNIIFLNHIAHIQH